MTKKSIKKKAPPKKKSAKTTNTTKKTKVDEPSLKIISTSKCQSISGKASLNYNVATDDEGNIFIRVSGNTGGGYFSNEWISLDDITSVLSDVSDDQPITSINLFPLFRGKSVNTPSFLLAVLLKEGLLAPVEDKKRKYQFVGADKFLSRINKKIK